MSVDLFSFFQDQQVILYWLLIAIMLVGVIGSVIPALPGSSLVLAAILLWGLLTGFSKIGIALGVAIAVLILSTAVDFLATFWGAKKAGVSRWGQIGAMVGLIAVVFGLLPPALVIGGPIIGLLIGPFIGAFIGEFLYRRNIKQALKAAVAVVASSLIGNLIQGVLALAAVIVFVVTTWSSVMG
ncbi:DUF456 family protein [Acaryochloris sp. IP29b_bin.137]|uniref:DUF456 domain-containing protein n=1 Tax=Acaryochloris sp. IP29b_bin.137 TaxID=2969217 RepID=UPI002630AD6A|nr:DUF456 family protein [Acaryochloris sp. IP29b_bin.137]